MDDAGWHLVDGDEDRARYWDGNEWTDRYRPAALHYAAEQAKYAERAAHDVRIIKAWVSFLGLPLLAGLLLAGLQVLNTSS